MQMMEKFSLCYTPLPDVFEESSDSFSLIAIFYANSDNSSNNIGTYIFIFHRITEW